MASVPDRSYDQKQLALQKANRVRSERAATYSHWRELGRYVSARDAAEKLLDPPAHLQSEKVWRYLEKVPYIGERKVARLFHDHQINSRRTLAGLTERQRRAVHEQLIRWSKPWYGER
jgi:hypothetical protein